MPFGPAGTAHGSRDTIWRFAFPSSSPPDQRAQTRRAFAKRPMADGRAQIDAELANLRGKEAALKAAGKTAELKALAKRKGDLKLMKKKGISPVVAPARSSSRLLPSLSSGMPSMPSMPASMSMPPVPKWVSEFPHFTPPTEDDAAEFAGRPLGLGCGSRWAPAVTD